MGRQPVKPNRVPPFTSQPAFNSSTLQRAGKGRKCKFYALCMGVWVCAFFVSSLNKKRLYVHAFGGSVRLGVRSGDERWRGTFPPGDLQLGGCRTPARLGAASVEASAGRAAAAGSGGRFISTRQQGYRKLLQVHRSVGRWNSLWGGGERNNGKAFNSVVDSLFFTFSISSSGLR